MWSDIRFAARTLTRAPLFTSIAVLSLALGIGANTAVFSLLDQVLVRSLRVTEPERLVVFHTSSGFVGWSTSDNNESVFSYPLYKDLRDRSKDLHGVVARGSAPVGISTGRSNERARAELVSGNYFQVLGVSPVLGRSIEPADDGAPGASPVVMLSAACWQKRFGSDLGVIGRKILVNAHPMVIIGVAPSSFKGMIGGTAPEIFVPIAMKRELTPTWYGLDDRRMSWLTVFGRLRPGVSMQQASASTEALYRPLMEDYLREAGRPADSRLGKMLLGTHLELHPGTQGVNEMRSEFQSALVALMTMVGIVLLIACANVAGLLTARASGRRKEIAVRLALGARRVDLIRQLLVESVLLALAGGSVGLLVVGWTLDGLLSVMGPDVEGVLDSSLDLRMLAFTLGLSVVTGVVFGLVPALQATRPQVAGALKDHAATVASGTGQVRFRRGLVVAQVALSLLLLVAAGLFGRSVSNLMRVDPGFKTDGVLMFAVNPNLQGYTAARVYDFYAELQRRLATLPGVASVGATSEGPLTNSDSSGNYTVEGYQVRENDDVRASTSVISSRYFDAIGVPIVQGRDMTDRDIREERKVVLVNEAFAKKYGGGRSIIGRHLAHGAGDKVVVDREIVGVVRDFKHDGLRDAVKPAVFDAYNQGERPSPLTFYVRSSAGDRATLGPAIRKVVSELDQNLPVSDMQPVSECIAQVTTSERLIALLASAFGLLATVLAAVGLYGVIAFIVVRRTPEIGVRIALGAAPGEVLTMVIARGVDAGGGRNGHRPADRVDRRPIRRVATVRAGRARSVRRVRRAGGDRRRCDRGRGDSSQASCGDRSHSRASVGVAQTWAGASKRRNAGWRRNLVLAHAARRERVRLCTSVARHLSALALSGAASMSRETNLRICAPSAGS